MNIPRAPLRLDYEALIQEPCRLTISESYFINLRETPMLPHNYYPDAILLPPRPATAPCATQPSAARVQSRGNLKRSDWLTGDKIILVLLYTCDKRNLLSSPTRTLTTTEHFRTMRK
mgnify:CR=1 FL=1